MSDINHIKTNNLPLLDELIYNLKKEMFSAVLKDEEEANNNETLQSAQASDRYLTCVEGRARPETFDYDKYFYYNFLTDFPEPIITAYLKDPDNMDVPMKNAILSKLSQYYINSFIELNPYYRMLNGTPPIGEEGVYLPAELVPRDLVGLDISVPLHEMQIAYVDILYSLGVMDKVIDMYPDKKYLNYLGSRCISIYNARTSPNFSLLYVSTDVPDVVYDAFREKIELNRVFTLRTVYSDAYKFESDYYTNFIRVFILVQTYVDIITEMPGMIIRREIFDRRMVELLFKTHGIDYFYEIPMTYQIAMIRNLNTLLQYKSTDKNIIDICSLFGFDNIVVFKYYLLKERVFDPVTKKYLYSEKEIPNPDNEEETITVEDFEKDFELKFVKVPLGEQLDDYIHDSTKVKDYSSVVLADKYWQGDRTYEDVQADILNLEFNHYQSKYISIDALYNMAEMSFQVCYFFNMIFDNVKLEEMLTLDIPYISADTHKFKFVDIICYLLSLGHLFMDIEDSIMDSRSKIMYIYGFDFDADMQALAQYALDKGYTLEDLGVANFQTPKAQILNYKQLMNIFTTNKNIRDHVINEIKNADNKKIYDIYSKMYDSLMTEELTFEFFKKPDGTLPKTYKEFLQYRDLVLYNSIVELELMTDKEDRNTRITDLISNCVYVIESSMDLSEYKYIFSHLPGVSIEAIKRYIYKVVNFFKSYKVQIESINTVYVFDDKLENMVKMIDKIIITHHLTKTDVVQPISKLITTGKLTKKEKINIMEKLCISAITWVHKTYYDNISLKESALKQINLLKKDGCFTHDIAKLYSTLMYSSYINLAEKTLLNVNTSLKDKYEILDDIHLSITHYFEKALYELDFIKDDKELKSILKYASENYIMDRGYLKTKFIKNDKYEITDSIQITVT